MTWTVVEFVWLIGLFKELGADVRLPIDLFCNNKAAHEIATNLVYHERTKHIEIDCYFVRGKIQQRLVITHHVSSKEQQGTSEKHHEYLV